MYIHSFHHRSILSIIYFPLYKISFLVFLPWPELLAHCFIIVTWVENLPAPNLMGVMSIFSLLNTCCRFFVDSFVRLKKFSVIPSLLRDFFEWMSNDFSACIEMIMFSWLYCYIVNYIDCYLITDHPYISGINFTSDFLYDLGVSFVKDLYSQVSEECLYFSCYIFAEFDFRTVLTS
jgi:hypothetical protein